MSEKNTAEDTPTPDTPEDTAEDTPATEQTTDQTDTAEDTTPNREAAKYRRRLRDTETQLAHAQEQVTALQRQIVDDLVSRRGYKPALLWASGANLDDLLNNDGTVSPEKVTDAADTAGEKFGVISKQAHQENLIDPSAGRSGQTTRSADWSTLLRRN